MENIYLNYILDNIESEGCEKGIVVASPSKKDPNYYYHWIRDSAIIIRTLIKSYEINKDKNIKEKIINYVNCEIDLQTTKTLSGLGEPKFNIDKSSFNDNWGRPQNDSPALRSLAFIEIYNNDILEYNYEENKHFINKIIYKNIKYICDNIHNPCFDLWEEEVGFHLYTRLVQTKAIKEYLKIYKGNNFAFILKKYKELKEVLNHHLNNEIISSYTSNGKILRKYDSSVFLGICHINFDTNILDFSSAKFKNYMIEIENMFKNKYVINDNYFFSFLGRYLNDKYYNGQIWYICTIGLLRLYNKLNDKEKAKYFIKYLNDLEDKHLSEQIEDVSMKKLSAEKLTWNYSEIYNLLLEFE